MTEAGASPVDNSIYADSRKIGDTTRYRVRNLLMTDVQLVCYSNFPLPNVFHCLQTDDQEAHASNYKGILKDAYGTVLIGLLGASMQVINPSCNRSIYDNN